MKSSNLLLLDTETTGVDVDTSNIIQIAWSVVSSTGTIIKKVEAHFTKTVDTVPFSCSAINHIIYSDIEHAHSIDYVLTLIEKDCIAYSIEAMVCHNLAFDAGMLSNYAIPENLSKTQGICTLKLARYLYPDFESHSLQYLRYTLSLDVPRNINPHRADSDVIVLGFLLRNILTTFNSLAEVIEICDNPILIKRFPFGKHKGTLISEIPKGYIYWALGLSDLDSDLRYSLNKSLRLKK